MILDAYPVLAFLLDEPAASHVESLLRSDENAAVTTLGLAEVVDCATRRFDAELGEVVSDLARLELDDPIPLDEMTAVLAGDLRARHYHHRQRPVSLADCVAAASAARHNRRLVSSDAALLDLCHDEGIDVHPIPDSAGHTWIPRSQQR